MSSAAPSNREVVSVSQLNRSARRLLEGEFPMVWVEGEISNFSRPSSGHWYLSLKDESAQLRCAMFVNRNRLIRFKPANGMQVVIRGKISLYEGRGEFQMIAEFMEEAGDGQLIRAFEKLKAELQAEGLFSPDARQALPAVPTHLGIITSPTGAAIADVLHVLERRFPALRVSVIPVQVQGDASPAQIVSAIEFANRYQAHPFDVLLLTRGGGSLEDLWSFNTEQVARAIFASRIPIVAGVGHETDVSIADFVADVRAPTPSAAAEIISPDAGEWSSLFDRQQRQLTMLMNRNLQQQQQHLQHVTARLQHPGRALQELSQRLDGLEIRLRAGIERKVEQSQARLALLQGGLRNPAAIIDQHRNNLAFLADRLSRAGSNNLTTQNNRLQAIGTRLNAVSPLATLERGYAIVSDTAGRVLTNAANAAVGDTISARLMHGKINATVINVEEDE